MQACSFGKFCLGTRVCATGLTALDTSTSSIERECHAGPHPKLERDLQQEVEGGRQPVNSSPSRWCSRSHAPLQIQSQYYLADHAACAQCEWNELYTFKSSRECFTTFVNDAELAIVLSYANVLLS